MTTAPVPMQDQTNGVEIVVIFLSSSHINYKMQLGFLEQRI